MKSYMDLFNLRGSAYDQAMRLFPEARKYEFMQAVRRADIGSGHGQIVLDVPAGGGYLAEHLPPGCQWLGHEPCAGFRDQEEKTVGKNGQTEYDSLLPLPWVDNTAHRAISLAGVHHLEDKRPLFDEVRRVIRPGGRFVLSDVPEGSAVAMFLDEFVGATNSTGHDGIYLTPRTASELVACGWELISDEIVDYHWVFNSREDMARFCIGLFDLQSASPAQTIGAVSDYLGIDALPGGKIGMRWRLQTVVVCNPA